jgi:outer membrane protein assembly factor BamB
MRDTLLESSPRCQCLWRQTLYGALLVLAAIPGRSADWPMFRGGPTLAGLASEKIPDKPVLVWSFKTGAPVKSSAAIVQDHVFIGSSDNSLYALNLADGKKAWSIKTGGEIESSPLVLDDKVFVGSSDNYLYAFQKDGKLAWKYETGDKILGSPNWENRGGRNRILVGSYDFKLHCLDAATGKSNWVYETGNYINGSPAVGAGQTAFGGCDGLLHVLSLGDGRQIKEIDAGAYIAASVALVDGHAYFGQYENQFLCIDIAQGKKDWIFKDRNYPYFSSPAVTKDRVVFGGRDKLLHCVKREDGSPVWSFATRGKVDSSPVVCGDRVVVGSDDGRLYIVSMETGKELWSYEIGQAIESSPAVAESTIVIGCDDGNVYCFGEKTPDAAKARK